MWKTIKQALEMIRFSHTVFALPFALLGAVMAWSSETPDDMEVARRQGEMTWISRIQDAIDADRLRLYMQPIVTAAATAVHGDHFEILVRMVDENGDAIPPGHFLPAAERYNLMPSLDRWVLEQVFEHLVCRSDDESPRYTLAVNLSGNG